MAAWGLSDIVQNPAVLPPPVAAPSFPMVPTHSVPGVGAMSNMSDDDYAKMMAGLAPTQAQAPARSDAKASGSGWGLSDIVQNPDALKAAPASPDQPAVPPAGHPSGLLANMGAGTSDVVAGTLGAPVDAATWGMNLIPRGINAVAGTHIPQIQNPVGGPDWWKSAEGQIGADPRNVTASTPAEQSARAAGQGAASMVLPWAGARALPALAGIPGALQQALGSGSAATQAAIGVGAGTGGQVAENAVPEPYKPLANMGGQILGGGLVGAPIAAANGVLQAGAGLVRNFAKPFTAAGRDELAGQRIANAATDIGAVHDALDAGATPLVPGSEPTTFQATGDQGLGNLERAVAKNNPDQFIERSNDQNAARVAAIQNTQAAGDTDAVGASFKRQLANIDAQNEAVQAAHLRNSQRATEDLGNAPPQAAEDQATALQAFGNKLRGGLDKPNQEQKAKVSKLYAAVDPDGTLAVDLKPFKSAVKQIAAEWPKNAKPLTGEAGAAFDTARLQPNVQLFSEVGALRQRIGDAMAAIRGKPEFAQEYRALTKLRAALDDTLSGAAAEKAANDPAVAHAITASHEYQSANGAGNRGDNGGLQSGPGQAGGVSSRAGEQISAGSGRGNAGGGGGVSAEAATPLAGPNRQAETLHDFLISKGGIRAQGGELRGADLQAVHHRAGGRLINNTRGMPLDYAREAAVEDGFLPANATVNDFLDAVTSHSPVYRIHEAADAGLRAQAEREGRRTENALYDARDAVNVTAEDLGVRLTPAEREHAAYLRMQGAHPEDAIRDAKASTEDVELQRNAEHNAVGRPGVPLAAQQADNGLNGANRLVPNFDADALARRRAADAAHAERMQTFGHKVPGVGPVLQTGDRPGEFKMGASQVPSNLFKPGAGGAERIQAVQRAAAGNPRVMSDLQDYAAFSFRRAAEGADGTIDPAKAATWLKQHSEVMGAFPDLRAKFDTAVNARAAMDQSAARQADQVKAFQTAAVSKIMATDNPAATVGRILNSDTALSQMQDLAKKTAGDPAARAGLRRAVVEHVMDNLRSNTMAGDGRLLKNDAFQTFVRKTPQALRTVFTDAEVKNIQAVAEDLARSQKSVSGTKLPGGSNTAQDLAAGDKHGSHSPSVSSAIIASEVGGEVLHHVAGTAGKIVGLVVTPVVNAMRSAGIAKVDDLVTQAMLNPALAKTLLSKIPPSAASARGLGKIIAGQIQALGINSAIGSERSTND